MTILAVIPCLNEARHLAGLLDQMLADPAIDRIVVADGGSTDGSRQIVEDKAARDERVRLLDNPDRIQSAGINRAVSQEGEGFDWLLRIDAHCRYPNGYVSLLVTAALRHDADCVVVPMITGGSEGFQLAIATAQNSLLGTGGSAHRHVGEGRFVDHGHHALMSMTLFREVCGYCEAMACNEDAELDHRLRGRGGRIWLEPSAAIEYFPRARAAALWRQYYRYGGGRARNLLRHRSKPRLRQLFPLAVPMALALLPLGSLNPVFVLPALAWLLSCLLIGGLSGLRAGGGWRIAAGVAAAIMHLAWSCGFLAEALRHPRGVPPRYGVFAPTDRQASTAGLRGE